MDPFALALDAQFLAPGSTDAFYVPSGGVQGDSPIRVIRSAPDREVPFGAGQIIEGTNLFLFRKADVPDPVRGDLLVTADGDFELLGEAEGDVEDLTWTMGARPAP